MGPSEAIGGVFGGGCVGGWPGIDFALDRVNAASVSIAGGGATVVAERLRADCAWGSGGGGGTMSDCLACARGDNDCPRRRLTAPALGAAGGLSLCLGRWRDGGGPAASSDIRRALLGRDDLCCGGGGGGGGAMSDWRVVFVSERRSLRLERRLSASSLAADGYELSLLGLLTAPPAARPGGGTGGGGGGGGAGAESDAVSRGSWRVTRFRVLRSGTCGGGGRCGVGRVGGVGGGVRVLGERGRNGGAGLRRRGGGAGRGAVGKLALVGSVRLWWARWPLPWCACTCNFVNATASEFVRAERDAPGPSDLEPFLRALVVVVVVVVVVLVVVVLVAVAVAVVVVVVVVVAVVVVVLVAVVVVVVVAVVGPSYPGLTSCVAPPLSQALR